MFKPFLRWAGGKSWLIKHLDDYRPMEFNNYHELFLGGASVYFNMPILNDAFLSDLNPELIETYKAIKADVDSVLYYLKKFTNTKEEYYQIRSSNSSDRFYNAAKFIFLNKTSFNGIYRVNRKGTYNVPFGFRFTIDFIQEDILKNAALKLQGAELICQDFGEALKSVGPKDFVFIDPPYTVAHEKNGFIAYNQKLFSLEDQYRLSQALEAIKEKGAFFLMTNAYHDKIREIYQDNGTLSFLERPSLIGGKGATRQVIKEYIIHNLTEYDR